MIVRNSLSLLGYAIALALFIAWFWRARRLTGGNSSEDQSMDARLRGQLRWLMIAGFAILIASFGLSLLPGG